MGCGNGPRQAISGDEATLTMGKILTANHAGKFPGTLRNVKYKLTAVRGFDNANESIGASGKPLRRRICLCRKRPQQNTIR